MSVGHCLISSVYECCTLSDYDGWMSVGHYLIMSGYYECWTLSDYEGWTLSDYQ